MGSIFKRGRVYWIQYFVHGLPQRESVGKNASYEDAKRLLARREGDVARGVPVNEKQGRVKISDLIEDYKLDFAINKRKSQKSMLTCCKHLMAYFTHKKAASLTTGEIRRYIGTRLPDAANATINRELAALKRALNLARENGRLLFVPHFPMLKESNSRKGFFEHEQFLAVMKHLPYYLKPVIEFAYITGWRRGEVLGLQWRNVDFENGVIRLDPGTTKNDEARVFPMTERLRGLLIQQSIYSPKLMFWVFTRNHQPIHSYYKSWRTACAKAGLAGKIPHDFRRTAVRNLIRVGIPERFAMAMCGHKTRFIFDRYHIVTESDLKEAGRKLNGASLSHRQSREQT